jgi:hemerythrin superfamily protein
VSAERVSAEASGTSYGVIDPTGAAVTHMQPEQDVVDVLTTDHREALDLLGQIWGSTDSEQQRDLTDTLIAELVRHSAAEEMYVYPAMKKHLPSGDEEVQHDIEEHKELEQTMKKLEDVQPGEARFTELLRQLETTLRDHIDDEESDQFPQLRARIPRDELVEMAGKVETAKKVAPTRPHPAAPNHQLFHKTVGPGVGLVDRLKDKLSGRQTG